LWKIIFAVLAAATDQIWGSSTTRFFKFILNWF